MSDSVSLLIFYVFSVALKLSIPSRSSLSVCLSACLSVCLSLSLPLSLSLSLSLSLCLCLFLVISLSLCLSLSPSLSFALFFSLFYIFSLSISLSLSFFLTHIPGHSISLFQTALNKENQRYKPHLELPASAYSLELQALRLHKFAYLFVSVFKK